MKCLDVVKEDMQEVGAREDDVFDRSVWRIHCGDRKAERRRWVLRMRSHRKCCVFNTNLSRCCQTDGVHAPSVYLHHVVPGEVDPGRLHPLHDVGPQSQLSRVTFSHRQHTAGDGGV